MWLFMNFSIDKYFPDIQSITQENTTGFVLLCKDKPDHKNDDKSNARYIQQKLNNLGIRSFIDIDKDGFVCVIPQTENLKKVRPLVANCLGCEETKDFIQYTITLCNFDSANNIEKAFVDDGYNAVFVPDKQQVIVKCLPESEHNTAMERLKNKFSSQQHVDSNQAKRPNFFEQLRKKYNDFKLNYGVCPVPAVSNAYRVYHLSSDAALRHEGQRLNVNFGVHYMDNVYYGCGVYSVRKKRQPCATLLVKDRKIVRTFVHKNVVPCDEQLREVVRAFMEYRGYGIPDNSFDKYIGYLNQNGKVYDIYDLHEKLVVEYSLDLDGLGLHRLPNLSGVTINGDFLCRDNQLKNFVGAPDYVSGTCYFSHNYLLDSLDGFPHHIGGRIVLLDTGLNEKSYVPDHIESYINNGKIVGVSQPILDAWKQQIAQRRFDRQRTAITHCK